MKMLKASLVALLVLFTFQTVASGAKASTENLFYEGFEDGDLSEYWDPADRASLSEKNPYSGSSSLRMGDATYKYAPSPASSGINVKNFSHLSFSARWKEISPSGGAGVYLKIATEPVRALKFEKDGLNVGGNTYDFDYKNHGWFNVSWRNVRPGDETLLADIYIDGELVEENAQIHGRPRFTGYPRPYYEPQPLNVQGSYSIERIRIGDSSGFKDYCTYFLDDFLVYNSEADLKEMEFPERVEDEKDLKPAPEDSLLVARNEWRKLLLASVATGNFVPESELDKVDLDSYSRIYHIGEVGLEDATAIKPRHIPELFFPNRSKAVVASGNRSKMIYAALYAESKGLPLVLLPQPNLTEINLSKKGYREAYLDDRSGITHVTLANTEKPSSALAADYAEENYGIIATESSDSIDEGYSRFKNELVHSFELLSDKGGGFESKEYLAEGATVTLFGTPMEEKEISSLPNATFLSDFGYLDITNNSLADLKYGRIPGDISLAFQLLENHTYPKETVIAAEYRKTTWPEIVAFHGGAMWYAKGLSYFMEDHNKSYRMVMENRTSYKDVRKASKGLLLASLGLRDPTSGKKVIIESLNKLRSEGVASAVKKLAADSDKVAGEIKVLTRSKKSGKVAKILGGLMATRDVGDLLKAYLEFRPEVDKKGVEEAIKDPVDTFNPISSNPRIVKNLVEYYPELDEETLLQESVKESNVFYFGEGNSTHWILPNNQGFRLPGQNKSVFNQYNGSNSIRPRGFSGSVFDGSSFSAKPGALYQRLVEGGSNRFIGFTGKSYVPYGAKLGKGVAEKGFTWGQGVRKSLNSLETKEWTFSTQDVEVGNYSIPRQEKRREAARKSLVMYGQPKEPKDPEIKDETDYNRSCKGEICNYSFDLGMESSFENDTIMLGDVETARRPGKPTVYYKTFEKVFPSNSSIKDVGYRVEDETIAMNTTVNDRFPEEVVEEDIYELPDGRKKLVAKVLALQYASDEIRLIEYGDLEVKVEQPAHASLNVIPNPENSTFVVKGSGFSGNASVLLKLYNSSWRNVVSLQNNFSERRRFGLDVPLSPGRYNAELFIRSDTSYGPLTKSFTVEKDYSVVSGGKKAPADRLVAMNFGNVAMLASIVASMVSVPAASATITGDFTEATSSFLGEAKEEVEEFPRTVQEDLTSDSMTKKVETAFGTAKFESRSEEFVSRLETPQYSVKAVESPDSERQVYKSSEASIEIEETFEESVEICETSNGELVTTTTHGNVEKEFEGVDREKVEDACKEAREKLETGLERLAKASTEVGVTEKQVEVVEVHEEEPEYLIVRNKGPVQISLANWSIADDTMYDKDDSVKLEKENVEEDLELEVGETANVTVDSIAWNNGEDTAYLYNRGGELVDELSYGG
ncbi:MAG: hypothetical protein MUP58_01320 [Candidatus Nanohaloarchaeota archaeon QJJ-9]|nr:hypothetical protein [Candidatus Nanohaloarchaeota archaeon QJJ-9]